MMDWSHIVKDSEEGVLAARVAGMSAVLRDSFEPDLRLHGQEVSPVEG